MMHKLKNTATHGKAHGLRRRGLGRVAALAARVLRHLAGQAGLLRHPHHRRRVLDHSRQGRHDTGFPARCFGGVARPATAAARPHPARRRAAKRPFVILSTATSRQFHDGVDRAVPVRARRTRVSANAACASARAVRSRAADRRPAYGAAVGCRGVRAGERGLRRRTDEAGRRTVEGVCVACA
eukprot:scaffold17778_cov78-Phaeocystis_antarctica.AAC.10